jgi:hypothetical protein
MDLNDIKEYTYEWRDKNHVKGDGPLNEQQLTAFAKGLQERVAEFSTKPQAVEWDTFDRKDPGARKEWRDDAAIIAYSGDVGDTRAFKIAAAMSRDGKGDVFYISDTPAGKLLRENEFKNAVIDVIGGVDETAGRSGANRLIHGFKSETERVDRFATGDVLPLDDYVSQRIMKEARGDLRVLVPKALPDRVFYQTELPELLDNKDVKSINVVPREVLKEVYDKHSIEGARTVLSTMSHELVKNMRLGQVGDRTEVDAGGFFKGTKISPIVMSPEATHVRRVADHADPDKPDLTAQRRKAAELLIEANTAIKERTGQSKLPPAVKDAGDALRARLDSQQRPEQHEKSTSPSERKNASNRMQQKCSEQETRLALSRAQGEEPER